MSFDAASYAIGRKSGGGGGVTVEALSVTENGTYTAEEGTAYSPVVVEVPNPNSVETIRSTLDSLFTSAQELSDLIAEIDANNATVTLETDANSTLGFPATKEAGVSFAGVQLAFPGATIISSDDVAAMDIRYTAGGLFASARAYMGGSVVDVTPYASMITCTLTIIHHPLPSGS